MTNVEIIEDTRKRIAALEAGGIGDDHANWIRENLKGCSWVWDVNDYADCEKQLYVDYYDALKTKLRCFEDWYLQYFFMVVILQTI